MFVFYRFSVLFLVFSASASSQVDLLKSEVELQYQTLLQDIQQVDRFTTFQNQTFHPASLVTKSDRDPLDIIVRRTRGLLDDIRRFSIDSDLSEMDKQLHSLEKQIADMDIRNIDIRRKLFTETFLLQRKIAFSNPLLDFDKILFIKRHRSNFNHMGDQFYGNHAVPGGGVFVLTESFGDSPVAIDLLKDVAVKKGRLKGGKLATGSFLSPELSYDGKTLFFAYVECSGPFGHITHLDHAQRGHWHRGRCYHLFSAQLEGLSSGRPSVSNLCQLTDGTFNDFDPCLMPNGRIAFISERRGGYLRCGRACPSYTVHDMNRDGSDIRILSPHENNEWHPSVSHDGMLLYTRWDYVDRHGCTAHHPWMMTPDGRDSRAMHGNFSTKHKRADMEMDLRSIPGSEKIIGIATPHHGQAYGSVIIFDPQIPDDDAMAPVQRLTPDVGFPETQGGKQVYGTPWPLSETYHLCVYDAGMRNASGRQGAGYNRGNYGIYLLDAFGNKVLIYRDPEIACLSPMPLRPRTMPPVLPDKSSRLDDSPSDQGTMAVIDAYDSLKPWPEGTQIKALRIYQIYPCSVPSGNPPHEVGLRIKEAGDSVNLARRVVGTVPVEEDGSAYFTVPALKELYFQALDENGLAIQSMRSATWVQPGEFLTCYGCHEPKHRAVVQSKPRPLALQRAPSVPTPDVEGSSPFSFPLLVQPVLDRKCMSCHEKNVEKGAPPLDRTVVTSNTMRGRPTKVFRSYDSLKDYAFTSYGDQYRTIPGKFGARASRLYQMLHAGHHDVQLTKEELHRITLWLDSLSNFYGVYEKEQGQTQLRGNIAYPTLE